MKKTLVITMATLVLSSFGFSAHAEIECKASMMGRICFAEDGRELTVAEMQAATAKAEKKAASKMAKK